MRVTKRQAYVLAAQALFPTPEDRQRFNDAVDEVINQMTEEQLRACLKYMVFNKSDMDEEVEY